MSNTNQRFVQDINRLIEVRKKQQSELPKVSFEPISTVRGIGDATMPPVSNSGSFASPLKEIPGTRIYGDTQLIKSSDGLFVMEQQTIKQAQFEDANGIKCIVEFQP